MDIPIARHEQLFGIQKSVLYHSYRRRYFEQVGKTIKILTVFAGSGACLAVVAQLPRGLAIVFTAVVTALSIIDLVVKCNDCARVHEQLGGEFIDLESRFIKAGDQIQENELNELITQRLAIEKKEPTKLRVLDTICHNEVIRARGYSADHYVPVNRLQRCLAQSFDYGQLQLETISRSTHSIPGESLER